MNPILLAVNDGLANNNWNEADVSFLVGVVFAVLSAIAYAAGVGTVAKMEGPPDHVDDATTKTPVGPASTRPRSQAWAEQPWYYRFHEVAAALLAIAVAAVGFGLFLQ